MEMRAIGQARGALAALAELLPDYAERICIVAAQVFTYHLTRARASTPTTRAG